MARPPEIFRDQAGEWRFRVRGGNGETVATGEGHGSPADAERSLATLRRILRDTNGDLPTRVDQ
jgi:uncharacterized protein YegP (UPF0339 family)